MTTVTRLDQQMSAARQRSLAPILAVDLDGTLIAGDLFWEGLAAVLSRQLWLLALLPWWLLRGRAFTKRQVALRWSPDVAHLPYRAEVLQRIEAARRSGQRIVLATGADRLLADCVAQHLGHFDDVLASDGDTNLRSGAKLLALQQYAGPRGFEYIGDSRHDVPILAAASRAILVNPSAASMRRTRRWPVEVITCHQPPRWKVVLRALRPHQWAKNLLILVPLVLAHQLGSLTQVGLALAAAALFSLCASSIYLLNDLMDLEADRRHPTKRHRPLAAAQLSVPAAAALMTALFTTSFCVSAACMPVAFTALMATYGAATTLYSAYLKRKLVLDVLALAGLYTLRIFAGGAVVGVAVSEWLLAFSMFVFLSLALLKRYIELRGAAARSQTTLNRRGYQVDDLPVIEGIGPATGCLAVLVFCLYVNSASAARLYPTPLALWLLAGLLWYWTTRVWLIARRGAVEADPVAFLLRDRASYAVALAAIACLIVASGTWRF